MPENGGKSFELLKLLKIARNCWKFCNYAEIVVILPAQKAAKADSKLNTFSASTLKVGINTLNEDGAIKTTQTGMIIGFASFFQVEFVWEVDPNDSNYFLKFNTHFIIFK